MRSNSMQILIRLFCFFALTTAFVGCQKTDDPKPQVTGGPRASAEDLKKKDAEIKKLIEESKNLSGKAKLDAEALIKKAKQDREQLENALKSEKQKRDRQAQ
jgi:hypothetical protein